ncbi:uncharacterized [Tachysurus ichikawai]
MITPRHPLKRTTFSPETDLRSRDHTEIFQSLEKKPAVYFCPLPMSSSDPLSVGLQPRRLKKRAKRDRIRYHRTRSFLPFLFRAQEMEMPSGLGLAATQFCMMGHGLAEPARSHDPHKRGLRNGQSLPLITWVEP